MGLFLLIQSIIKLGREEDYYQYYYYHHNYHHPHRHVFVKYYCLLLLLIFSSLSPSSSFSSSILQEQEADRIRELPGQPSGGIRFAQFSGYVTVDDRHGRALFYWLTETTSLTHLKPLLLWLNGGPGCSSVAYGASEEIGPFRINKTGSSLYLNKYAWNREANIIFLESPAGVGFSYTNTSSDLKTSGDKRTGHYIPQLAKQIYHYNKENPPIINLKGFMVGNAVTDDYYDGIGTVTYWWSHSMISDLSYKSILKYCNFTSEKTSKKCDDAVSYAVNHEFGNIDQYSIYTPSCPTSHNKTIIRYLRLKNKILHRISGYDPCTEDYAEKYYNRPDVQKAMHANVTNIPYKWTACSGDTDSIVPVTATRFSLNHLNLTIKTPWYPWYSAGQVGGWTEVYEGLTFATVRGAGHEVPLFQPKRAFTLFKFFLAGKELPKS